ncbi:MAG: SAP domain-containing protein [Candidatus Hodarchaeota archaeon]
MTSKGGKIPSGSKVSAGSKVSSGKSEQGSSTELGMSYWELQLETMNRKQLRKKAKGMDLSTSGSKDQLKNRIKKELMKEKPIDETTALKNIPEGSITTAHFEEEDFQVSIVDKDIEPHIEAKTERLGEGVYSLKKFYL